MKIGRKKKKPSKDIVIKGFFKMFKREIGKFVDLPNLSNISDSMGRLSIEGMTEQYLFDFHQGRNISGEDSSFQFNNGTFLLPNLPPPRPESEIPDGENEDDYNNKLQITSPVLKIKVRPVEILEELEVIPTPFSLIGLDDKIKVMKEKESIIQQKYAKREVTALIERLENRKKFEVHQDYFIRFQNTNDEKIDILLTKYDLVLKSSDIFIPEFPAIAINIMTEYTEKTKLLCEKKPVFYVIATDDKFKEKFKRRDPILLVQSPFGFYWQILGAWDKEMILLTEL